LDALRFPYQNANITTLVSSRAPKVEATPIPALAPVDRPFDDLEIIVDSGLELGDMGTGFMDGEVLETELDWKDGDGIED